MKANKMDIANEYDEKQRQACAEWRCSLHQAVDSFALDPGQTDILNVVPFISFLCGRNLNEELMLAIERMEKTDDYYSDPKTKAKYGGFDPWEVDAGEARKHLHFLIDCLPAEDLRTAKRYFEFCLS